MKKLWMLWMLALLPYCLHAQNDAKAAEVLDKTLAELSESDGIRANFEGTDNGFLLLKGEKFYLSNDHVQSWYDGKTQWSYVAETGEVNVSTPTPDELKGINPYFILKNYKADFNYAYKGNQTRNGMKGHAIVLTSKPSGNQDVVRVFISKAYHPMEITIERNGQTVSDIKVTSYQTNERLDDGMFRFNKSLYPDVEIIDLR